MVERNCLCRALSSKPVHTPSLKSKVQPVNGAESLIDLTLRSLIQLISLDTVDIIIFDIVDIVWYSRYRDADTVNIDSSFRIRYVNALKEAIPDILALDLADDSRAS